MVKPFRKIQTSDRDLNLVQEIIKQTFDSILRNPLLDGVVLKSVALASGSNTIGHGLGRNYVSWALFRPSAVLTLYETASPDPSQFLVLVASATAVVDLLVL